MTVATEEGHWYTKKGEPAYETVGANGKLRPTNIRDAKKHGYKPSVSMIMDCAAKDALGLWKIKQHLLTATGSPYRPSDETASEFISRILSETKQRLDQVPDLGSAIHGAIERCLAGHEYEFQSHVAGALKEVRAFCGDPPYGVEKSFAHPLGYGGRVDLHKPGFVIDFKTKDFTSDNLPPAWDNHAIQLAAYREGLRMPSARCAIIFVSTAEPGLAHTVKIPEPDLERGWKLFRWLLGYWQDLKQYQTAELVEA